jgi:hypothetical protein
MVSAKPKLGRWEEKEGESFNQSLSSRKPVKVGKRKRAFLKRSMNISESKRSYGQFS